jgi:hypothetical protein
MMDTETMAVREALPLRQPHGRGPYGPLFALVGLYLLALVAGSVILAADALWPALVLLSSARLSWMAALAVLCVFGRGRWLPRWLVAIVCEGTVGSVGVLMSWLYQEQSSALLELTWLWCLTPLNVIVACLPLLPLRFFGGHQLRTLRDTVPHLLAPWQFGIGDLLGILTLAALVLGSMQVALALNPMLNYFIAIMGTVSFFLTSLLLALPCVWAAMLVTDKLKGALTALIGAAGVLAVLIVIASDFFTAPFQVDSWMTLSALTIGPVMCTLLALHLVRRMGYELQRPPRTPQP